MAGQFSLDTFRVVDGQIPAVRAAVEESLDELRSHLRRLQVEGVIKPWLGDPVSENVVMQYNARVMGAGAGAAAPGSAFGALIAYQAELVKIKENLDLIERGYGRTDGDTAGDIAAVRRSS
jgi:hypothetical protein